MFNTSVYPNLMYTQTSKYNHEVMLSDEDYSTVQVFCFGAVRSVEWMATVPHSHKHKIKNKKKSANDGVTTDSNRHMRLTKY